MKGIAQYPTSYMVGREDKRTSNKTMFPALKKHSSVLAPPLFVTQRRGRTSEKNAAAGYQGPVKIELFKGAGLLEIIVIVFW